MNIIDIHPAEVARLVEWYRTSMARTLYAEGKQLDEFASTYLPQGRRLISPEGVVLIFEPAPREYGSPNLGGQYGMNIARMGHHQRFLYCLSELHVNALFFDINNEKKQAFLDYVLPRFDDAFDVRLDCLPGQVKEQRETGLEVLL